jgi:hypothetical protein
MSQNYHETLPEALYNQACSSVVAYLPSICKALKFILSTEKKKKDWLLGVMVHAYTSCTQEAKAGGS